MDDQGPKTVTSDISHLIADNQNDPRFVEPGEEIAQKPQFPADATLSFGESPNGDVLDLADVLLGSPDSQNIDNYLLAINNGGSSTLLVDTDGSGNFANPDLVFEIGGVDWDSSVSGQMADLVADSVIIVVQGAYSYKLQFRRGQARRRVVCRLTLLS
eukprot:TRINITY_DN51323_c0_g1_i1.p1 TRINITY_DN51323_c0_g1~~TRINITY_DN51323_c0_g1_i1.p1  ORF type:complete len:158 (+),score=12.52 TRINITY_DN51323_c0_g1_i1:189-662(+)